jgi:hypothetical protein
LSNATGPVLENLEDRTLMSFTAPVYYGGGATPIAVISADLNNDGHKDILASNSVTNTISASLGNGDGTFQAAQISAPLPFSVGSQYTGAQSGTLAAADFNGDGFADAAVVTYGGGEILLGNGDGTFQAPVAANFGAAPCRIASGDVNGDGKLDLAVANTTGYATILIGNGDGTFAAPVSYFSGSDTQDVRIIDLNHDGKMDMVSSNAISGGTISSFLGNGDGTFQPARVYGAFSAPYRFTVGDYNGDGNMDVVCANSYTSSFVSVLYGNGDGSFQPYHSYNTGTQPWDIQSADFDGDGKPDLIEQGGAGYNIEMNNGDGTFSAATPTSYTGTYFVADDFNGDGTADIVGGTSGLIGVQINTVSAVTNVSSAVGIQVSAAPSVSAGSPLQLTVSAIDANGAVVPDFQGALHITSSDARMPGFTYNMNAADAGTHSFTSGISLFTQGLQTVTVSGPASLTGSTTVLVTNAAASHFAIFADATSVAGQPMSFTVNALDLYGNLAAYTGSVHFSSSDIQAGLPADYTFTDADQGEHTFSGILKTAGIESISAVDASNTNVRGTSPFMLVSAADAMALSLVGGGGHIGTAHSVTVRASDPYGNLATGYNGTVHLTASDPNMVLPPDGSLVNGVGSFAVTPMMLGAQTLSATDINSGISGTETISGTPGDAAIFVATSLSNVVAGTTQPLSITAYDRFGNIAVDYGSTVIISGSDAQAGAQLYTFTAADAGTHSFNVTLRTAGSQSVSVRDYFNAALGETQGGIVVTPSTATSISMSSLQGVVAGTAQPVTVTAHDVFGNVATGYRGTINFSSTDAIAVLPAAYTFTEADGGVHTFGMTFESSGGQSITVADSASALMTVTQRDIPISPAALSTFSFKGASISNTTAGASFSVTVSASDAFGNTISGYTGTVQFSSSDAQASIPSSYTFSPADGGSHTFNIALKTAGTQSIIVTDSVNGALTGTQSTVVKAAAISKLVASLSSSATAGTAQSFTVTATDAFGNPTGYTGTVHFSSSDAQAILPANYTFTNKDSGTHTFNVTFKTAGNQSLTVADTVNGGLTSTQSVAVTASNARVAGFSVSGLASATAGSAKTFTVVAKDAQGNTVTGYAGTITFSSSDVAAGLPASYTFTAADAGSHTFAATLKTAGTQSITATDSTAAVSGSQAGIVVTAGAAAMFVFSAPTSVTQGVGFKFTMTVLDAYGNVATGYVGKVKVTSSDAKAGSQSYTFSSNDKGVHTFSWSFNALGSQSITVQDTGNTSLLGSLVVNVVAK